MIQVNDLSFGYRKKQAPLFGHLNLDIQGGTICGILGKNGAGKTTLLRLISGLLFPTTGTSSIHGLESRERPVSMLADLFYVQEEYVFPELTMYKYVELNAPFYPRWDQQKFIEISSDFELGGNRKIKELSFGQKKKFLIAFALATGSKLLIMDEPTNGMDIPSKTIFRKVVSASLGEDQCFLISTHQVKDVSNLLDRIVVIEGGKVIFNQDVFSISSKYRFDFQPGNALPAQYLYAETVPGGHMLLNPQENQQQATDIDLEILFNAIISKAI